MLSKIMTDCKAEFTEQGWQAIWRSPMLTSNIVNITLQSIKSITRWYLTPLKRHYIDWENTPFCLKGFGQLGNFIYIAGGSVFI